MKLVNKLISSGIIRKEDTDLYEYAINILKNYILFFLIVLFGNLLTKNYMTTFLFLFVFFALRRYIGGLHLESKKICLFFSLFLTFFIPYLAESLRFTNLTILYSQLIVSFIISIFPIIETPQKHISTIEKKVYKQRSFFILFIIYLLNITLIFLEMIEYSTVILLTLLVSLLSTLLGFIKYN